MEGTNKNDIHSKMISRCETSILARHSKFEGKVTLECKLHIDGEFIGEINSSNIVVIAKSGKFKGNIKCEKLIITGQFIGQVKSNAIEILKTGIFKGKMSTKNLLIEPGAIFEGENKGYNDENN